MSDLFLPPPERRDKITTIFKNRKWSVDDFPDIVGKLKAAGYDVRLLHQNDFVTGYIKFITLICESSSVRYFIDCNLMLTRMLCYAQVGYISRSNIPLLFHTSLDEDPQNLYKTIHEVLSKCAEFAISNTESV
jgi:hypothetical protein